jgi:hypothetical protein
MKILIPLKYKIKSYGPEHLLKSNDIRIYEGSVLLSPGTWADSVTNAPVLYRSDILSKYASNWEDNLITLGHDPMGSDPLRIVGTVQNQRWENGSVVGDLYINTKTQAGRDAVSLIEAGLVNNVSVEMMTKDYWDSNKNVRYADNIRFKGVAIVGNHPACKNTRIK